MGALVSRHCCGSVSGSCLDAQVACLGGAPEQGSLTFWRELACGHLCDSLRCLWVIASVNACVRLCADCGVASCCIPVALQGSLYFASQVFVVACAWQHCAMLGEEG